ncbi:MAG: phosphoribosylformylglycinamidine synthase subunit PurQ, partial [Oscillospiraceae bacterium]|nr:phosphoribosylformylglycinamidine synthase subunit PurQ [Oscillospiraceae bacterium]
AENPVYLCVGETAEEKKAVWEKVYALHKAGKVNAAWAVENGVAEAVMKMGLGNGIGFTYSDGLDMETIFGYRYGSFILELTEDVELGIALGTTTAEESLTAFGESADMAELFPLYESKLEGVFHAYTDGKTDTLPALTSSKPSVLTHAGTAIGKPQVLIPVFPGTNCEFDTAKVFADAGAEPEIFVIRNLTADAIRSSVDSFAEKVSKSQIVFLPGGFSGGDEPDGSAKFITAFFRNPQIKDAVHELLKNRDGLMGGICNGFQALIKLGLVPNGEISDSDPNAPTLTFNTIGRHQSRLVRTKVCSVASPWLMNAALGETYTVAISHGEGRFLATEEQIRTLAANGQILTQYVNADGEPTTDILCNPNGSAFAIEGILSPDGRVFGKMGHSERIGSYLYKNVPGNYDMGLFASAVQYFK